MNLQMDLFLELFSARDWQHPGLWFEDDFLCVSIIPSSRFKSVGIHVLPSGGRWLLECPKASAGPQGIFQVGLLVCSDYGTLILLMAQLLAFLDLPWNFEILSILTVG